MRKIISNTHNLKRINSKLISLYNDDISLSFEKKIPFPKDLIFNPASMLSPARWYIHRGNQTYYRYEGEVGDIGKHKDNLKYIKLKFHFLSGFINGSVTNNLFDSDGKKIFSLEEYGSTLRVTFNNETYILHKLPLKMIVFTFSNQKFYHDASYNLKKDGQRDLLVRGIKGSRKIGSKKLKTFHGKV